MSSNYGKVPCNTGGRFHHRPRHQTGHRTESGFGNRSLPLQVYVHDQLFRDFVLEHSANVSFAERFFLQTELEEKRFLKDGTIGTEDEIVYSRVRNYFADRPDLGAWFVNFLETGNADGVSEDLFTFIALRDGQQQLRLLVVDVDDIPVITAEVV
jgi:hypothetical protein